MKKFLTYLMIAFGIKQIEYLGLHYMGAQNYPSKLISEEKFESRWQKLAVEAKELN